MPPLLMMNYWMRWLSRHLVSPPGAEGLLVEVSKRYAEILVPHLKIVLLDAFDLRSLPPLMNKAIFILLLKPGKDGFIL